MLLKAGQTKPDSFLKFVMIGPLMVSYTTLGGSLLVSLWKTAQYLHDNNHVFATLFIDQNCLDKLRLRRKIF